MQRNLEHPQDVLHQWLAWRAEQATALVVVTAIEGGGVRAPGAMMAVASDGRVAGYISGGCIDADVALQAEVAMKSGETCCLRYGAGSPFVDLPLPCGGAIEVMILPNADEATLRDCRDRLAGRAPVTLYVSPDGHMSLEPSAASGAIPFRYTPKLRLRIAGRGADCLALAHAARASGIETALWLPDGDDVNQARKIGLETIVPLSTPNALPPATDDAWTAFVLAFHDRDWEDRLLAQALNGPAFHIAAIGSRHTHLRRCEALREAGYTDHQISRIHGPAGLVPSMRDASFMAISILAEVIDAHQKRIRTPFARTALVLLAAGQSSRFERGDKLMAPFKSARLLDHAAHALAGEPIAARIAVVGPDQAARASVLEKAGWQVVINQDAAAGQSTSIRIGIETASRADVSAAMIMLADMPGLPDSHMHALRDELTPDRSGVMSSCDGTLLPPAIFSRHVFDQLTRLDGDTGAKCVFRALEKTAVVELAPQHAVDIDTTTDLERLEGLIHA